MKKLLLIFTLLFSTLMFSTPSYGEWKKVPLPSEDGSTHYVDFDGIRKHGGYIYWWELRDNLKIGKGQRIYSMKTYNQGDCGLFRFMILVYGFWLLVLVVGFGSTLWFLGMGHGSDRDSISNEWGWVKTRV